MGIVRTFGPVNDDPSDGHLPDGRLTASLKINGFGQTESLGRKQYRRFGNGSFGWKHKPNTSRGGKQSHRSKHAHHSPLFVVEKVDPARERGCNGLSTGKVPGSWTDKSKTWKSLAGWKVRSVFPVIPGRNVAQAEPSSKAIGWADPWLARTAGDRRLRRPRCKSAMRCMYR